jgi:hypothetical protein
MPVAEPVQGFTVVDLTFEDGCTKGITANMPTSTITYTPTITDTPTMTPTPDCSAYSMTPFFFNNFALQNLWITNGDVVDTVVQQIQLDWNYAEQLGITNGYPNLNVDWFSWESSYINLDGDGGARDYDSPTNWGGSRDFDAGDDYEFEVDFDGDWAGGGPLPGVVSSDFGIIVDFANGCQLRRDAVPRPIITWTPSLTPTFTWTPSPPPPPTSTPLPSNTPLPTATPLPTFTPTITWTPSITPSPTDTLVPSATSIPTNTQVPSDTPVPSETPDWDATATASSPTPSSTPVTPSPTPVIIVD